ncbi:hypothetical protein BKA56DRAFT_738839 [Ilyonectria sp. MPI-CAGE-AT-0026]|nr:hypothetical protein BKA56DRAFT_738839 [Ilyonectria sp. MPI-CAGE-AT-0026]
MAINKAISQLLVRRLFEAVNGYVFSSSEIIAYFDQNEVEPIPTWIALLLCGTLYLIVAVSISVSYTLGHVVNTLTMIEVSAKAIAVDNPLRGSEGDRNAKRLLVSAATLRTPKPITAHIQTTIQHLRAAAGFWSRWRGWRFAIIYSVVAKAIQIVVNPVLGHAQTPCEPYGFFPFVAVVLTAILTSVVVAPLHMAWTHATIAIPSKKGLRARLPSGRQWKLLLVPTAVLAATEVLGQQFMLFCQLVFSGSITVGSRQEVVIFGAKTVSFIAAAMAYSLFISLPAEVTLARIEAAMLPGDEYAIVPFDHSLDGRVVPTTGFAGFCNTWHSFRWETRWRLSKPTFALFAIQAAILLLGIHLISLEIWATMGKDGFRMVTRYLIDFEVRAAVGNDGFTTVVRDLTGLDCFGLKLLN